MNGSVVSGSVGGGSVVSGDVSGSDVSGRDLPALARAAVTAAFGKGPAPTVAGDPGPPSATFVTIRKKGELRGCIGTTRADRPLLEDVQLRARAAAFSDPRFEPVTAEELTELTFEVSVLSPLRELVVRDFEDACEKVRPGIDGVAVRALGRSGLLLPQVWESLTERAEFLDFVWKKAGLPRRYWAEELSLYIFSVEKFEEGAP